MQIFGDQNSFRQNYFFDGRFFSPIWINLLLNESDKSPSPHNRILINQEEAEPVPLGVNLDSWKSSLEFMVSRPFTSKSLKRFQGLLQITSGISLNLASEWINFGNIGFPEWAFLRPRLYLAESKLTFQFYTQARLYTRLVRAVFHLQVTLGPRL